MDFDAGYAYDALEDEARDTPDSVPGSQTDGGAPRYTIPQRTIGAVEVPAVVKNVDRAVKAFGRFGSLTHVREDRSEYRALINED